MSGPHRQRASPDFLGRELSYIGFCKRVAQAWNHRDSIANKDAVGNADSQQDVFLNTDSEADSETEDLLGAPDSVQAEAGSQQVQQDARQPSARERCKYRALVQKLHVNTGHASNEQMLRLAHRAKASAEVIQAIKEFKCAVCEELQVPPSHRVAALSHTETPNHIVGLDIVQVELKKDSPNGVIETKFNVLTAVDYATDFAQQVVFAARASQCCQSLSSTLVQTLWSASGGLC